MTELLDDAVVTARAATVRRPHRLALPVLLAGTFVIVLDFFIVNVALPSMQRELHAGPSAVEWVVAGYGLTFAALLLAAGRLGDRWGRRRMLLIGTALFTAASAACGAAPTAGVLVAARLVQGAAGALISPTVLAIIGVLYAGAARARAIGIYATVLGVAAVGGQLIGGVLLNLDVAGLGWRSVFLINVPTGLVILALVPSVVPESSADGRPAVDWLGMALATAGLTTLVLPLLEGRQHGWPLWTWLSLAASPVLLAEFALRQRTLVRRGGDALLDLRLFRSRSFSAGLAVQLVFWCGQASYFMVLALFLQQGRGLTALRSGLVFTFVAGAYLVTSAKAPAVIARWGRRTVTAGALLLAGGHAGLLAATLADGTAGSVFSLAPGLVLTGAGMGFCITALTTTVLSNADPSQAGAVSGALSTVQQVGNALGVAVIGLLFFGGLRHGYAHAFSLGEGAIAGLIAAVAGLSVLLPARR